MLRGKATTQQQQERVQILLLERAEAKDYYERKSERKRCKTMKEQKKCKCE